MATERARGERGPAGGTSLRGEGAVTLRVAVVGARRVRNGTGSWVARGFARAWCEVVAVVGTSGETAARARDELAARDGLRPRAYDDTETMLAREAPDVVAVCSPTPAHADTLERLVEHGAHCLCEKPLVWSADPGRLPSPDLVARARAIAEGFASRGRLLALNTQWPWTLTAFEALHPGVEPARATRFEMWLCPAQPGAGMVPDSLPHVLSMLAALRGPGTLAEPRVRWRSAARDALDLRFVYRPDGPDVEVRVRLSVCARQPRPAGYAIDGHRAEREVEMPSYRMTLVDGERRQPLPDPLDARLVDFVDDVRRGTPTDVEGLARVTGHLITLARAVHDRDDGGSPP